MQHNIKSGLKYVYRYTFVLLNLFFILSGCKKLVSVSEPVDTITTPEAFSSDANATSALVEIYNSLIRGYGNTGSFDYGNGVITLYGGLSADELNYFSTSNINIAQFQTNNLKSDNSNLDNQLWRGPYFNIYLSNAVIEGLSKSSTVSDSVKKQLLGEAKFLRAFNYFYLVNIYGDVPLTTSTLFITNSVLPRTDKAQVYQQIINDLKDAQSTLANNYSFSNSERIRANKFAATALLARVYLYINDWVNAEAQSNLVIADSSDYYLTDDLNATFLANSSEAIWQLKVSNLYSPYATNEAKNIIPTSATAAPIYYLTSQLLNAFEPGDLRKTAWLNSTLYRTVRYYYPYKYTVRQGTANGNVPQYYMMFRLAEQYLIRAEARAKRGGDMTNAIYDLNKIRKRAGLAELDVSLTQDQVVAAVEQERKIELFSEWGHRWFDLKRTGRTDDVLGPIKGSSWQTTDQLYPIPFIELVNDPNLKQNQGYE